MQWNTATEVNNYGFEIERRAIQTQGWTTIAFVEGAGSSNSPKEYSYTDQKLAPGVYVYRIKQIDSDGAFTCSASAQIDVNAAPKTFQLFSNYPNPFNPEIKIQYSLPENATVHLSVYDMIGRQVAELVNEEQSVGYYEKDIYGNQSLQRPVFLPHHRAGAWKECFFAGKENAVGKISRSRQRRIRL